jgi:hypothetical protein
LRRVRSYTEFVDLRSRIDSKTPRRGGESRGVSSIVCVDLTVGRVQNRQCVLAAAISVGGSYGHQVEIDR